MRIKLFESFKKSIEIKDVASARHQLSSMGWTISAITTEFAPCTPTEILVKYQYLSQDEQQAGNYPFPTQVHGIREDGTSVLLGTITPSDRFGNVSGSQTITIDTKEEFAQISVRSKWWKYKAGSYLEVYLKKAKTIEKGFCRIKSF